MVDVDAGNSSETVVSNTLSVVVISSFSVLNDMSTIVLLSGVVALAVVSVVVEAVVVVVVVVLVVELVIEPAEPNV